MTEAPRGRKPKKPEFTSLERLEDILRAVAHTDPAVSLVAASYGAWGELALHAYREGQDPQYVREMFEREDVIDTFNTSLVSLPWIELRDVLSESPKLHADLGENSPVVLGAEGEIAAVFLDPKKAKSALDSDEESVYRVLIAGPAKVTVADDPSDDDWGTPEPAASTQTPEQPANDSVEPEPEETSPEAAGQAPEHIATVVGDDDWGAPSTDPSTAPEAVEAEPAAPGPDPAPAAVESSIADAVDAAIAEEAQADPQAAEWDADGKIKDRISRKLAASPVRSQEERETLIRDELGISPAVYERVPDAEVLYNSTTGSILMRKQGEGDWFSYVLVGGSEDEAAVSDMTVQFRGIRD